MIALLRTYLRPYARPLALVVALLVVQAIATLYLPELNADIINNGVVTGDTAYILSTGAVMLGISLVVVVCAIVAVYWGSKTGMAFGRDVRSAIFRKVESFSQAELDRFGTASLITRNTNDVQQVQMVVLMGLNMMIIAPILAIGGVVMALRQDIPLAGILIVILPIMTVIVGSLMYRAMPLFQAVQRKVDRVNQVTREALSGIRVIRAFVRTEHEQERFDEANRDLTATSLQVNRLFALMIPSLMLVFNLSTVAILWFGSLRVASGEMPIGNLIAFLQYVMQILMAVMMAVFMFVMVPRAVVSSGRIQEVLRTHPSIGDPVAPVKPPPGVGSLEFRDVTFGYPGAEDPVLRDITFRVEAGQTTAIVGSTGSGKSTLINLIPRFYDVSDGSLSLDGTDIRELLRDDLWTRIGLIPQKSFLFTGTIASNLRYGKADATDEELWAALRIAQAESFVRDLPEGLDASIAQGGTNLSGGQRQRLAIARALVKRPEIYVFDDSFSALDFKTDSLLRAALTREIADATVVIVAQRVGTIMGADRIVVARWRHDRRHRDARGTHGELRDVSRDRLLAAQRGGGRVSGPIGHGSGAARRPPARGFGGGGPFGTAGLPPEKARDFRGTFGRLVNTLRPEVGRILIVVAFAIVSVACAVVGPKLLGNATNILFDGVVVDPAAGVDMTALRDVLLVVAAVYILSSLFSWAQSYIMAGVSQRTVYRMRRDVDVKLSRLPLRYFDSHPRGDTLSRVTNDIDNIANSLQQTMTQLITAVCTIIGVLAMMLWISPLLAVISLLTVPLSIVVTVFVAKRSQVQFATQWARTGRLNGHVEEMHTGHSIVKAFGRQEEAIARFDEENEELFQASYKAQFLSGTIQPAMQFIANINYVLICVIGGIQVANGQMSLGDVQAFVQYSRQFTMPITQTASIANVIQSAVASAERVFELLDEAEEAPDAAVTPLRGPVRGRVELEGVSFRYVADAPLIENLDLVVEPGHTIAIVGPTGAGKTTLVNLLMRFYEIDAGRITVDGIDSKAMSRDELRSTFGMVLQDTWLFNGTIRENIAYGREDATEEEIVAAAQAAHVDHFVRTLPDGYDTILDDDATSVSQGEKQLLTIARAFLADRRILILDEATSSVDTRTEVLIQRAMAKLMLGRTSFVIAHRLSTIRDADMILVMDHGSIVEQGTHDALIARRGFYFDLYDSQFAAPLEEAV